MAGGPGGGSVEVGAVSFRIGVDLSQFQQDLARAEELARTRAQSIQQHFNSLSMQASGVPQEMAGSGTATGPRPRRAAEQARAAQQQLPGLDRFTQRLGQVQAAQQTGGAPGTEQLPTPEPPPPAAPAPVERIRPVKTRDYHTTETGAPEPVTPPTPVSQQREVATTDVRTSVAPQELPKPPQPSKVEVQVPPQIIAIPGPPPAPTSPYTQVNTASGQPMFVPSRASGPTQTQRQVPPTVSGIPAPQRPVVHIPPTGAPPPPAPVDPRHGVTLAGVEVAPPAHPPAVTGATTAPAPTTPAAPVVAPQASTGAVSAAVSRQVEAVESGVAQAIDQGTQTLKGQIVRWTGAAGARMEGRVTSEKPGGRLRVNVGGAFANVPREQVELPYGYETQGGVAPAAPTQTAPAQAAPAQPAAEAAPPPPPAAPKPPRAPRVPRALKDINPQGGVGEQAYGPVPPLIGPPRPAGAPAARTEPQTMSRPPELPRSGQPPRVHLEPPEEGSFRRAAYVLSPTGIYQADVPYARGIRTSQSQQAALSQYFSGEAQKVKPSEFPPYARHLEQIRMEQAIEERERAERVAQAAAAPPRPAGPQVRPGEVQQLPDLAAPSGEELLPPVAPLEIRQLEGEASVIQRAAAARVPGTRGYGYQRTAQQGEFISTGPQPYMEQTRAGGAPVRSPLSRSEAARRLMDARRRAATVGGATVPVRELAHGGRAEPGKVHLIGEHGPELFVPKEAGYVLSNEQTRALGGLVTARAAGGPVKPEDSVEFKVAEFIRQHKGKFTGEQLSGHFRSLGLEVPGGKFGGKGMPSSGDLQALFTAIPSAGHWYEEIGGGLEKSLGAPVFNEAAFLTAITSPRTPVVENVAAAITSMGWVRELEAGGKRIGQHVTPADVEAAKAEHAQRLDQFAALQQLRTDTLPQFEAARQAGDAAKARRLLGPALSIKLKGASDWTPAVWDDLHAKLQKSLTAKPPPLALPKIGDIRASDDLLKVWKATPGTLRVNVSKSTLDKIAQGYMTGFATAGGFKTPSYYSNIGAGRARMPDPYTTIDTWMAGVFGYGTSKGQAEVAAADPQLFRAMHAAVTEMGRQHGMHGYQMQAALWTPFKTLVEAARAKGAEREQVAARQMLAGEISVSQAVKIAHETGLFGKATGNWAEVEHDENVQEALQRLHKFGLGGAGLQPAGGQLADAQLVFPGKAPGGPPRGVSRTQQRAFAAAGGKDPIRFAITSTPLLTEQLKKAGIGAKAEGGKISASAATDIIMKRLQGGPGLRPAADVAQLLGAPGTPSFVPAARAFMQGQSAHLAAGEVTQSQVAAAYLTTLSSIRGKEQFRTTAEGRSGFAYPASAISTIQNKRGLVEAVRPEDAFAHWLMSDAGKRALDAVHAGHISEAKEAIYAARKESMGVHGFPSFYPRPAGVGKVQKEAGPFRAPEEGAFSLVNIAEATQEINRAGKSGIPGAVEKVTGAFAGIGAGKQGFLASWVGSGRIPTLDINALQTWLGPEGGKLAEKSMGSKVGQAVVGPALQQAVIQRHQEIQQLGYLSGIEKEHLPALMHWALFDAAKKSSTSHQVIIDALMQAGMSRALGGLVAPAQLKRAASGLRGLLKPNDPTDPSSIWHGHMDIPFTPFSAGMSLGAALGTQILDPNDPAFGIKMAGTMLAGALATKPFYGQWMKRVQPDYLHQVPGNIGKLLTRRAEGGDVEPIPDWLRRSRESVAPLRRIAPEQLSAAGKPARTPRARRTSSRRAAGQAPVESFFRNIEELSPEEIESLTAGTELEGQIESGAVAPPPVAPITLSREAMAEAASVEPEFIQRAREARLGGTGKLSFAQREKGGAYFPKYRNPPSRQARPAPEPVAAAPVSEVAPPEAEAPAPTARTPRVIRLTGGVGLQPYGPAEVLPRQAAVPVAAEVTPPEAEPEAIPIDTRPTGTRPLADVQKELRNLNIRMGRRGAQIQGGKAGVEVEDPAKRTKLRDRQASDRQRLQEVQAEIDALKSGAMPPPGVSPVAAAAEAAGAPMVTPPPSPRATAYQIVEGIPQMPPGGFKNFDERDKWERAVQAAYKARSAARLAQNIAAEKAGGAAAPAATPAAGPALKVTLPPSSLTPDTQQLVDYLSAQISSSRSATLSSHLSIVQHGLKSGIRPADMEQYLLSLGLKPREAEPLVGMLGEAQEAAEAAAEPKTTSGMTPFEETQARLLARPLPPSTTGVGGARVGARTAAAPQVAPGRAPAERAAIQQETQAVTAHLVAAGAGIAREQSILRAVLMGGTSIEDAARVMANLGVEMPAAEQAVATVRAAAQPQAEAALPPAEAAAPQAKPRGPGLIQRLLGSRPQQRSAAERLRSYTDPTPSAAPQVEQAAEPHVGRYTGTLYEEPESARPSMLQRATGWLFSGRSPQPSAAERLRSYTEPTPRAAGGPAGERQGVYLVGERGPEIFVPHAPGYVLAHDQARRAVAEGRVGRVGHRQFGGPVTEAHAQTYLAGLTAPSPVESFMQKYFAGGNKLSDLEQTLAAVGKTFGLTKQGARAQVESLQAAAHPLAAERQGMQAQTGFIAGQMAAGPPAGTSQAQHNTNLQSELQSLQQITERYLILGNVRAQDARAMAEESASAQVLQQRIEQLAEAYRAMGATASQANQRARVRATAEMEDAGLTPARLRQQRQPGQPQLQAAASALAGGGSNRAYQEQFRALQAINQQQLIAAGIAPRIAEQQAQQITRGQVLAERHRQIAASLRERGVAESNVGAIATQQAEEENRRMGGPRAADPQQQRGGGGGLRIFGQTPTQLVREVGAIAGVNLGFNVMTGLARQVHDIIAATVDETFRLSAATSQLGATYGQTASRTQMGGFQQFAAAPLTAGTRADYAQTAVALAPLQQQFGATDDQIKQLNTDAGQLATMWGVTQPQAAGVLQQILRGNVAVGEQYNLNLVDQYGRIRGLNATYQELVSAVGPARAEQELFSQVQARVNDQVGRFIQSQTPEQAQLEELNKAWAEFRTTLTDLAASPVTQFLRDVNALLSDTARLLGSMPGGGGGAGGVPGAAPRQLPASSPVGALYGGAVGAAAGGALLSPAGPVGIIGGALAGGAIGAIIGEQLGIQLQKAGLQLPGAQAGPEGGQGAQRPVGGNVVPGSEAPLVQPPIPTTYPARAAGGGVGGSSAYLVGERGPELFVPRAAGYVYNTHDTMRALSGGGISPRQGGGEVQGLDVLGASLQNFAAQLDQAGTALNAIATTTVGPQPPAPTDVQRPVDEQALRAQAMAGPQGADVFAASAQNFQQSQLIDIVGGLFSGLGGAVHGGLRATETGLQGSAAGTAAGQLLDLTSAADQNTKAQRDQAEAVERATKAQQDAANKAAQQTAPTPTPVPADREDRIGRPTDTINAGRNAQLTAASLVISQQQGVQDEANARLRQAAAESTLRRLDADRLGVVIDGQRVSAQQALNRLAMQRLPLEQTLQQLQLRQLQLQNQVTIQTQPNLDTQRSALQAQLGALPAQVAVSRFQTAQTVAGQNIQIGFLQAARGQTPEAGTDFASNAAKIYDIATDPERVKAQRDLTLAQQNVTETGAAVSADQLQKAISVIPQQQELQGLERQTLPIQEQLAGTQLSSDTINRMLQFADLVADPARIQAQLDLTKSELEAANAMQVIAQNVVDLARGMPTGPIQTTQNQGAVQPTTVGVPPGGAGLPTPSGAPTPPPPPSPATAAAASRAADQAGQAAQAAGKSIAEITTAATTAYRATLQAAGVTAPAAPAPTAAPAAPEGPGRPPEEYIGFQKVTPEQAQTYVAGQPPAQPAPTGNLTIPESSGSGPRQAGGDVASGGQYLVGEKGPELFAPQQWGGAQDTLGVSNMLRGATMGAPSGGGGGAADVADLLRGAGMSPTPGNLHVGVSMGNVAINNGMDLDAFQQATIDAATRGALQALRYGGMVTPHRVPLSIAGGRAF